MSSPARIFPGFVGSDGSTHPVGWTCTFSMSTKPAPTDVPSVIPSPVENSPAVAGIFMSSGRYFSKYEPWLLSEAKPPVARITLGAMTVKVLFFPSSAFDTTSTPTTAPSFFFFQCCHSRIHHDFYHSRLFVALYCSLNVVNDFCTYHATTWSMSSLMSMPTELRKNRQVYSNPLY
mmetsp:Transcript_26412/g.54418  ORF Transcript_26412/g.54418 Transcript_26412/m.54418 type:complete len:176 (+) Transcript_26412:984-1511(+)